MLYNVLSKYFERYNKRWNVSKANNYWLVYFMSAAFLIWIIIDLNRTNPSYFIIIAIKLMMTSITLHMKSVLLGKGPSLIHRILCLYISNSSSYSDNSNCFSFVFVVWLLLISNFVTVDISYPVSLRSSSVVNSAVNRWEVE